MEREALPAGPPHGPMRPCLAGMDGETLAGGDDVRVGGAGPDLEEAGVLTDRRDRGQAGRDVGQEAGGVRDDVGRDAETGGQLLHMSLRLAEVRQGLPPTPGRPGGGALRKVAEDYDPSDRDRAYAYIREKQKDGEIVTGLLYLSGDSQDLHAQSDTVDSALVGLPYEQLCPGNAELQKMQVRFR